MTDRTVRVRLDLDNSSARRNSSESVGDFRRVGRAAVEAGAQQQTAFREAAAASQRAMERTAAVAQASGRVTRESVRATSTSMGRLAAAAEEVPATFRAAAASSTRSLQSLATSATATASSVAAAETRMSEASAAAAAGVRGTLAVRLAAGEALMAQQQALAASATASASAQSAAATGTATAVTAAARSTQASATATSTGLRTMTAAAAGVPPAFQSAAALSSRAMEGLAASTTTAAASVVAAEGRMTAATAAAATGTQLSLANRLALGQALRVQQGAIAEGATQQAGAFTRLAAAADGTEQSFKAVRTAGLVMLGVIAAASVTAARFEKAMSGVGAVANATAEQMTQLRDAALQAGRDTAFTASQAADAEAELARAGVSVADIVGGALSGALSLAAAGQLSLGEAATVSAQAMNTFGLKGYQVSHIADVLAAGANKSAADVHGLGEAMRMGGLLAHQTGLSFEDTVATLSVFADHALIGSDAGTSLKTMLQRLTPQSAESAAMMEQLGFTAYDAQGNFVGLTQFAARLKAAFGQLTPEARNSAMGVIFGSDAVRAATILYEQGAAGVDAYRKAVDDQGAAAEVAAAQMDNLAGDLQRLQGSLEVALIGPGSQANKMLRELVQAINDVVNGFASLPSWLQGTAGALLLAAGAIATLGAGFLLAVPRIAATQAAITTLAATMPRLAAAASLTMRSLGPLGVAFGIATLALGLFGKKHHEAAVDVSTLTDALHRDSGAVGENTRAYVINSLQKNGAMEAARKLGISLRDLTDAALGQADAMKRVREATGPGVIKDPKQFDEITKKFGEGKEGVEGYVNAVKLIGSSISDTTGGIDKAKEALSQQDEAAGGAAAGLDKVGASATKSAADLNDTRTESEKLADALDRLNGKNIDAAQSSISFQKGLADLRDTVKENGTSLDETTEKGRAVKGAFLDAAQAAMQHSKAVLDQTGSTEQANIVLGKDIDMLKATMHAAGFTEEQIKALTAAYANVPEHVTTEVTDPGAKQTISDLEMVKAKVEKVPPGKDITVKALSADAVRDLESIGYRVEHLPDGQVKVTVPPNYAFDGVSRIEALVRGIRDKVVTVTVRQDYVVLSSGRQMPLQQARGGITAAADGLTTGRQAGFSGRAILWAEAGREAYIPMDPSRRARSTMLLGRVADEFGLQLVPAGRDLIPTRALTGTGSGGSASYDHSRTTTVHLHGAKQSSQEQAEDVARRLAFIG